MKLTLYTLIILVLLNSSYCSHPKLIIELFRHGARGPLSHDGDPDWTGKEGQLTRIGQAQHLVLGASLVHRYPHLKKVLQTPERMYLQSTQFNRTIQSLKFHLWGMYHSDNITVDDLNIYDFKFYNRYQQHRAFEHFMMENISQVLEFEPTRVQVNPLRQEYELLMVEPFTCPNMELLLDKDPYEDFEFLMSMISHNIRYHTNTSLTPEQVYELYDLYYANLFEGKALGEKFSLDSYVWKYLKYGAEYFVTHQRWGSDLLRKIYGKPLLQKLMNFLELSAEGRLPYDLVLLSAHDVTVFNFLAALDIVNPKCLISKMKGDIVSSHCTYPNFASQILIELWERNGEPKIKIFYEKEMVNVCATRDGECSLSQIRDLFVKTFATVTLDDIFTHCGISKSDLTNPEGYKTEKNDGMHW